MAERLRADYSAMELGRKGLSGSSSDVSRQRSGLRSECDEVIESLLADNVGRAHLAIRAADVGLGAAVPVAVAGERR